MMQGVLNATDVEVAVRGPGHHYGTKFKCDYSDMPVTLIEQVAVKNVKISANREP